MESRKAHILENGGSNPSPAISNAVQNAVGVIVRELPITAEKVYKGMAEKE